MINETLNTASKLQGALVVAEVALSAVAKEAPYEGFELRWIYFLLHFKRALEI